MKILWTDLAWEDYLYWQANDQANLNKVNTLIKEIRRSSFKGIGKPEPLKANLKGWWSRRITGQHRMVYRVTGKEDSQRLEIVQCRHYY